MKTTGPSSSTERNMYVVHLLNSRINIFKSHKPEAEVKHSYQPVVQSVPDNMVHSVLATLNLNTGRTSLDSFD